MFDRNFLTYGNFELFSAEFKSDFKVTKWTFFEIILIYGIFPSFFSCFTFIITGGKNQILQIIKGIRRKKIFISSKADCIFFEKIMTVVILEDFEVFKNAILQGKRSKWFFGRIRVKGPSVSKVGPEKNSTDHPLKWAQRRAPDREPHVPKEFFVTS